MSDPSNLPKRTTPHWSLYQREIFKGGTKSGGGTLPNFSTDPHELEEAAKQKLSLSGWNYASSNAGSSLTDRTNREAFYRWRIIPRMLRDTNNRDTTIELFGHTINAPIIFSPIGVNKIYHPDGELAVAKVAGELKLPYCLSTAGSQPIEEVGKVNGSGPRFFQLYLPHDDELAISLLTRAWNSGFDVCIMTLDTDQLAWRHQDIKTANYAFYYGIGNDLGWSDPVFQKRMKEAGVNPSTDPENAGRMMIDTIWHGKAWSWDKIPWIMEQWKRISGGRPFLLKGIQSVDDARRALEYNCDGFVVSNHAGRQVDGAVGSLDMLPDIVDAVGDKLTILFDSGVRSGADVFKALALGAKAVCVGRMWIWGLSLDGEFGVRHVMKSLLADFDILMNVAGFSTIDEIDRKALSNFPFSKILKREFIPWGSGYPQVKL